MSKVKSEAVVNDSESGSDYEDLEFEAPSSHSKFTLPPLGTSLDKKEMWLIKTPKNFPLSKLKTLPVSFTAKRVSDSSVKPFSVDGHKYQVNEEHFSAASAKYTVFHEKNTSSQPSRFLTIREVVEIPEIDFEKAIKPREDVPKEENLRMRHFPTGYGAPDFKEAQPGATQDADGKLTKKMKIDTGDADKAEVRDKEKKDKKDKKEKKDKKSKSKTKN